MRGHVLVSAQHDDDAATEAHSLLPGANIDDVLDDLCQLT